MRKEGVKKKKKQREQSLKKSAKTAFLSEQAELPTPAQTGPGTWHAGAASTHVPRHLSCCALPITAGPPQRNRHEATKPVGLPPLGSPLAPLDAEGGIESA